MLTEHVESFNVVTMKPSESFWEAWERIRASSDPIRLKCFGLQQPSAATSRRLKKEAILFARSSGLTWEQIAESLGKSRQAIWQRGKTRPGTSRATPCNYEASVGGASSRSQFLVRETEDVPHLISPD